jgi:DNA-directed RNA polymerase specialized sigma24 family protein
MNEIDPLWADYLCLQARSRRRSRLDATGWGLEAGLNHLLEGQATGGAAAAVERGKARELHRARLRFRYIDADQVDDPTTRLDDRDRLRRVIASVEGDDRVVLLATGLGHDSANVALLVSGKPSAVRQRVTRLRTRLRLNMLVAIKPQTMSEVLETAEAA